jgi:hypothetical protein
MPRRRRQRFGVEPHVHRSRRDRLTSIAAVAPQIADRSIRSASSGACARRKPRFEACWLAGSRRWASGASNQSATSSSCGREVEVGRDHPDNRGDDIAGDGAIVVESSRRLHERGSRSSSSWASRRAAAPGSSPGSIRPPGKATWPAWVRKCSPHGKDHPRLVAVGERDEDGRGDRGGRAGPIAFDHCFAAEQQGSSGGGSR